MLEARPSFRCRLVRLVSVRRAALSAFAMPRWAAATLVGAAITLAFRDASAQTATPRVEAVYPHDTGAFTEGLELFEGKLYESTGLNGKSTLRRVTLSTGAVEKSINLDSSFFGEGMTRIDRTLIQLTYMTGVAIVYDLDTFAELKRFTYTGQGWGLCYDGTELVMTNGTDKLAFRDPSTFALKREITVQRNGASIDMLNELECVGSLVYINEWKTDNILRVDKTTGNVLTLIDASSLLTADEKRNADVLNGIAYDDAKHRFYLTGKYWPKLFEVSFDFDPGSDADAGRSDAGSADASVADTGGSVDAPSPRDTSRDAPEIDVAPPRDAGSRDTRSSDGSAVDASVPPGDATAVPDGGTARDGAAGSNGSGGAGGSGGTDGSGGSPTDRGCACRSAAGSAAGSWSALAWLLGATWLAYARRIARRGQRTSQ